MAGAWIAMATLAGVDGTAAATPAASYELQWRRALGAESCIGPRELADAVGAKVGRSLFDGPGDTAGRIEGEVRPTEAGWRVTISIHGPDGASRGAREIELDGADCRAIDASLTLVLALIVDPDATWGGSPSIVAAAPPAPPAAAVDERWRADAAITAAAGLGVLPSASVGARLVMAIDSPRAWPIAIGLAWWAKEQDKVGSERTVELRRWQAGLAVCTPGLDAGPAQLGACLGGAVGRAAARAVGFEVNREAAATLALATAAARATFDLQGPVFAAIEVGGELPLVRPRFLDDSEMLIYQVSPASFFGAAGVGVRF